MAIKPAAPAPPAKNDNGTSMPIATTAYTEQYKENCFLAWYAANRPRGQAILSVISEDEYGRKPHINVIQDWKRTYGWADRADRMDGDVKQKLEQIAIEKKVEMFKRHAEIGEGMVEIGWDYLVKHGAESAATARGLVKDGTELERNSTGGAQALTQVAKLTDQSLTQLINKLMSGMEEESPEVVDAEIEEVDTV